MWDKIMEVIEGNNIVFLLIKKGLGKGCEETGSEQWKGELFYQHFWIEKRKSKYGKQKPEGKLIVPDTSSQISHETPVLGLTRLLNVNKPNLIYMGGLHLAAIYGSPHLGNTTLAPNAASKQSPVLLIIACI